MTPFPTASSSTHSSPTRTSPSAPSSRIWSSPSLSDASTPASLTRSLKICSVFSSPPSSSLSTALFLPSAARIGPWRLMISRAATSRSSWSLPLTSIPIAVSTRFTPLAALAYLTAGSFTRLASQLLDTSSLLPPTVLGIAQRRLVVVLPTTACNPYFLSNPSVRSVPTALAPDPLPWTDEAVAEADFESSSADQCRTWPCFWNCLGGSFLAPSYRSWWSPRGSADALLGLWIWLRSRLQGGRRNRPFWTFFRALRHTLVRVFFRVQTFTCQWWIWRGWGWWWVGPWCFFFRFQFVGCCFSTCTRWVVFKCFRVVVREFRVVFEGRNFLKWVFSWDVWYGSCWRRWHLG